MREVDLSGGLGADHDGHDLLELYERAEDDPLLTAIVDELVVLRGLASKMSDIVMRMKMVQRCVRCPECLAWFVPKKGQKYCSPKCCSRASSRRHRRKQHLKKLEK